MRAALLTGAFETGAPLISPGPLRMAQVKCETVVAYSFAICAEVPYNSFCCFSHDL